MDVWQESESYLQIYNVLGNKEFLAGTLAKIPLALGSCVKPVGWGDCDLNPMCSGGVSLAVGARLREQVRAQGSGSTQPYGKATAFSVEDYSERAIHGASCYHKPSW